MKLHKLFKFFTEIWNLCTWQIFSTNIICDICDKYELCGVGARRPSKTQPRNCYCSQARWAKEFHCYQLKRAKQFNLHRNQILNMIWCRVASPNVQRCKVNCFVLFLQLGGWTIYYFYIQTNCTVLWNVGWIYNGAEKHCTFVIHFAGHGSGMAGVASIHPPEGHSLFSTY